MKLMANTDEAPAINAQKNCLRVIYLVFVNIRWYRYSDFQFKDQFCPKQIRYSQKSIDIRMQQ